MLRQMYILAIVLLPAGVLAAEKEPDLRTRQAALRRVIEQQWKRYREHPTPLTMPQVIRLRCENGAWVLSSDLPAAIKGGNTRVTIEGLTGLTSIGVTRSWRILGSRGVDSLNLVNENFSDPRALQVTSSINWQSGAFSISRQTRTDEGWENISLGNDENNDDVTVFQAPPGGVTFHVQSFDKADRPKFDITLSGPDLATLAWRHRRETAVHLRPFLAEMRLESMFAPDPLVAWQVFAARLKTDPAVLQKIKDILPALDDDDSYKRADAVAEIRKLGIAGGIAIANMDRTRLSVQQSVLLDSAMTPLRPVRAESPAECRADAGWLLDCLYVEDRMIRQAALDCLRELRKGEIVFDMEADPARRIAAVDLLRAKLFPATRPATRPASR
ncbi:MAG: hypothetical protein ACHRHE_14915 [Tepidisphaerales bacterium]